MFVYQRGMTPWGAIALDDISVLPGDCYSQPPVGPPDENGTLQSENESNSVTRLWTDMICEEKPNVLIHFF